jgi:hypothetical protein
MACLKFLNRVKVNKVEMIFMKFDKQGNVEILFIHSEGLINFDFSQI